MNPENIMWSEISQKYKYCMISLFVESKNKNKLTEKDQICGYQMSRVGEGKLEKDGQDM